LKLPITYNITLPDLGRYSRWGMLNKRQELAVAEDYGKRLRIKADSPRQLAGRMSGGNQQKVVIAKWIARGARVFLFDEPTRGIDIGAKQDVFEQMDQLARSGAGILMVSSELSELIQVADRILVMREGRLSGSLPRGATQEEIMRLAAPSGVTSVSEMTQ
jgi:ABC-type sugar transport system ATPase subunit